MANKPNIEELSDEELDSMLSESDKKVSSSSATIDVDSMSDEDIDKMLEESDKPKEEVKLSWPEKMGDVLTGGMISKGKQIQEDARSGAMGEKAQVTAEALKGVQDVAKTGGEIGQAILIGNATAKALEAVPILANRKVIQGLVASAEAKAANKGIRFSNLGKTALKLSIEGATSAQAFDYKNLEDRIRATAIASAVTPMLGISIQQGSKMFSTAGRELNKFKTSLKEGVRETTVGTLRDPRIPSLKRIQSSLSEADKQGNEIGSSMARQMSESAQRGKQASSAVSERTADIKKVIAEDVSSKEYQVRQSLKNTTKQINKSIEDTDRLLNKESDIAAKTYQDKVKGFFRQNSDMYGKELDSISDSIAQTGRMTRGEAAEVLAQTLEKSAKEADVTSGGILDQVKSLIDSKYGLDVMDASGARISRNADELINFKDFLSDVRKIWKSAKPLKGGAQRFTQDEIPAAILQSEFGEMVSRLPGGEAFSELQNAYRPVISYMNKTNSILQPYKGEAFRKSAYELVRRVAKNEGVAPVEEDIINFLENGTEKFAKGIGSVSARARQLGENIKVLSSELGNQGSYAEKRLLEIAKEGAMKVSKIDAASKGAQKLIEAETNRRSAQIMQEAALEQSKIYGRMKQLNKRQLVTSDLNRRLLMVHRISNGAVKLMAGLTSGYLVLKGGQEIVNTIGRDN
jgi:hypothetical protein